MLFAAKMSNYILSLHINFAARKSLKKSQRVADHIMLMQSGSLGQHEIWDKIFPTLFCFREEEIFLAYLALAS